MSLGKGDKVNTVYLKMELSDEVLGVEGFMEGFLHTVRELQIDGVVTQYEWDTEPFGEGN
jgi:hypothetical protein